MEEAAEYNQSTKEELIQIIVDLKQTIGDLKKEIEALKHPVPKDSTNSSIPASKDLIARTRSQREKSGKKSGGQQGHTGHHRERHPHPDAIVMVQASHCTSCGASLEEREGTIGLIAQEVDIPPITPLTTEYQQVIKVCACGHSNCLALPIEGYATIGPRMGALITYVNVEHALPYERLSQITHDLLGFAISQGTIANKLAHMQRQAKEMIQTIKHHVMNAAWIGSDETGTKVAGKKSWQWVWQSPLASYFVVDHRRGYAVVKEHFTESYHGVICHDCWSAQGGSSALSCASLAQFAVCCGCRTIGLGLSGATIITEKSTGARNDLAGWGLPQTSRSGHPVLPGGVGCLEPRAFDPSRGAPLAKASDQA